MSGRGAELPMSKTAYVAHRLREDLADGLIAPGEPLSQSDIAARYGVSATPVREALRTLEAEGLIIYLPHKGATVADMPKIDVHDLYLFRREVESLTVRLAVDRITPEQLARLRELHEEMVAGAATLPAEELSRMNREFHLAMTAAGSPFIEEHIMRPLWERVIPPAVSMWREPETVQEFLREHDLVLSAIENRDERSAELSLRNHISVAAGMRERRESPGD